jgi:hypothetical protein
MVEPTDSRDLSVPGCDKEDALLLQVRTRQPVSRTSMLLLYHIPWLTDSIYSAPSLTDWVQEKIPNPNTISVDGVPLPEPNRALVDMLLVCTFFAD